MKIQRSASGLYAATGESTAMQVLIFILLCVAVWLVYHPGLNGPFIFDDAPNITRNQFVAIDSLSMTNLLGAAFSKSHGIFGRPIPMLTFALNYYFAGQNFDPFVFKITNLAIHMANTALVYLLVRTLCSSTVAAEAVGDPSLARRRAVLMAALAAALWGLHPIQLTSVLYTVQRMTSMSAFFVLAGLLMFVCGRKMIAEHTGRGLALMAGGLAGGVSFGFLCKENSVLLLIFAPLTALVFCNAKELSTQTRRKLAAFYLLTVGVPLVLGGMYLILNPEFLLNGYVTRNFIMTERVLTELRVLFFYLSLMAFPVISRFGLYHDSFQLSTGLLDPISTLVALLAWCLLAVALVVGLRRRAIWAFGLAWFLGGHALESSIFGLELIHEHRNYVPSVGVFAAAAFYLVRLFESLKSSSRTFALSGLCVLLVFGVVTHTRAGIWSTKPMLFQFLVRHDPDSYRALNGYAIAMMSQKRDARAVYRMLRESAWANPKTVYPLIWMERVLQALLVVSSSEDGDAAELPEETGTVKSWDADPVLERDQLQMVDRALSGEIRSRLLKGAVHMETANALSTVTNCVLRGGFECLPLKDRLVDWHFLALRSLPEQDRRRAILELSLARLYAHDGESELALEFADRAISAGGGTKFRLHKGLLLAKFGKLEEASRIADEVEQGLGWRRVNAGGVAILRLEIQAIESQQAAPVTDPAPAPLAESNGP